MDEVSTANALPFVDEHSIEVAAGREATWLALEKVMRRMLLGLAARVLGAILGAKERPEPRDRLHENSKLVGFRVTTFDPPSHLALEGEHRFAKYRLGFRLESHGASHTLIRAETHASFPGMAGAAYRAVVVGSRGHAIAVRSMLRSVGALARRGRSA